MVSGLRSHEYKRGTWYLGKRKTRRSEGSRASDSYRDTRRRRKIRTPKPISKWISDSSSAHAIAHYISLEIRLSTLSPLNILSLSLSLKSVFFHFGQIRRSPLLLGWADSLVRVLAFFLFFPQLLNPTVVKAWSFSESMLLVLLSFGDSQRKAGGFIVSMVSFLFWVLFGDWSASRFFNCFCKKNGIRKLTFCMWVYIVFA